MRCVKRTRREGCGIAMVAFRRDLVATPPGIPSLIRPFNLGHAALLTLENQYASRGGCRQKMRQSVLVKARIHRFYAPIKSAIYFKTQA
jgi:hypothetical protein